VSSGVAGVRWVRTAALRPQRCLFIPFIGANHPKGFLTTNTNVDEWNHAYLSVEAAELFSRFMGWDPPGAAAAERAKTQVALDRIAELEAEVAERDRALEAAGLIADGYSLRRKPGRPKKEIAA
jgi:hypothetical protein